jgi:hypothetical protein
MNNMMTLVPGAAHLVLHHWRQTWRAMTATAEAAPRSRAEELASVRALADSYRRSDPGFASDLYAAADRHERAFEEAQAR